MTAAAADRGYGEESETAGNKTKPPPIDPENLRTVRFSFRLDPDLYAASQRQALLKRQRLSNDVERACIDSGHKDAEKPILNVIARLRDGRPLGVERVEQRIPRTSGR